MKRSIAAALFFYTLWVSELYAGIENSYGKFVPVKNKDTYTVAFVLNPENKKFHKIEEVIMFDYGNDEEGDISEVLHRDGSKEIFFRNSRNYWRFVFRDKSTLHVCGNTWSPKIVYRQKTGKWECSAMNAFSKKYMWWQIDQGLQEAKRERWDALAERLLTNIKRIIK